MSPVSSPNESFLQCHRPVVMEVLSKHLISDLVNTIAEYAVGKFNAFGSEDWKRVFGVQTEEFELDVKKFYAFWFAPDAEDLLFAWENPDHEIRLNCDTHFPPILRPQMIEGDPFDLKILGLLVQKPLEGYPSRFVRTWPLCQIENTKAESPCYLVVRKELFDLENDVAGQMDYMRNLTKKVHAGYEILPSVLDLSTVAHVYRVVTGKYFFSDATGMEKCQIVSRCKDLTGDYDGKSSLSWLLKEQTTLGFQPPLTFKGSGLSGGFAVHGDRYPSKAVIGVAGVWKISGCRKLDAPHPKSDRCTIA